MANSAPYEVNVTGTDDETFTFTVPFENSDGTAFPFDQYEVEYSLARDGGPVLTLTQANGVVVDDPNVIFRAAGRSLDAGQYQHGCRIRSLANDDRLQVFDGTVTIGEGNFR